MKRVLLILTAITLVFAVVGCGSNGAASVPAGGTTYEGTDNNGKNYRLSISADGKTFDLTVRGRAASVSTKGKVKSNDGTIIVLEQTANDLTATVNNKNEITNMVGLLESSEFGIFDVAWAEYVTHPFDKEVGIISGIRVGANAVFTTDINKGGVIDLTDTSGSKYFLVTVPNASGTSVEKTNDDGTKVGNKVIKITYICKNEGSGEPAVWLKEIDPTNKDWPIRDPRNKGSFNGTYKFKLDEVATVELPEKIFTAQTGFIGGQCAGDDLAYKLKIIKAVLMEHINLNLMK